MDIDYLSGTDEKGNMAYFCETEGVINFYFHSSCFFNEYKYF